MTDSTSFPPQAVVRSPLSDGEWHRMHPLSPLLRGGLALLVIIGIIVTNLRDRLIAIFVPWLGSEYEEYEDWESSGDPVDFVIANNLYLVAVLAVLGVLIVITAGFYLSWRFHTFRITGDDVEVRSGILFRTQRRAPLDRVQGVNLTRPMVARLLGMAKLEVVGAGTDSNVKLEYLSTSNAEEVRADILRLASGQRLAASGSEAPRAGSRTAALSGTVSRELTGLIEGSEAPVAEVESVVQIPVGRLVASHIVSPSTVFVILAGIALGIGVSQGVTWLLIGFIPAILGLGAYWVRSILRSLRYSIAPTPDGVRLTFGLLTTVTEIVPPGRIHALEVSQPILWRPAGWWNVKINRLSGRSATDSATDQFTTVLPVGTVADVERVLRLLQPAVPESEWALIAREGMAGPAEGDSFVTTPRRARIIRPLSWKRNGFRLTDDMLLERRGLVWRNLSILPLARLQSVALHQGPVDRMLGVASTRAHVVAGPVSTNLAAIDRDTAIDLLERVARGAVVAARNDRTHRWAAEAADAGEAADAVDVMDAGEATDAVDVTNAADSGAAGMPGAAGDAAASTAAADDVDAPTVSLDPPAKDEHA